MMENVRYNISPCDGNEVASFVQRIKAPEFVPNGQIKATDRSRYDRYSFLYEESKVAVVYDTSARILSITGREDAAGKLLGLFDAKEKTVRRFYVPSQGTMPNRPEQRVARPLTAGSPSGGLRAKLFISPENIRRPIQTKGTEIVTARGAVVSTDEIYPPQTIKKRPLPSYGESAVIGTGQSDRLDPKARGIGKLAEQGADNAPVGLAISVSRPAGSPPRRATISFGTEEEKDDKRTAQKPVSPPVPESSTVPEPPPEKRKRGRPRKELTPEQIEQQRLPKKRGRPRKNPLPEEQLAAQSADVEGAAAEYKNNYSIKNYPGEALEGVIKRLRSFGKTVTVEGVDAPGTPQELRLYSVSDGSGQKVYLRYAANRRTLTIQGKVSALSGEVLSQVSRDSDYRSALESYVDEDEKNEKGAAKKVSDVQNKLKKRLPTAFGFLSEQSRIDFSYCIHDFSQSGLRLSDYSVLLVPAFRGLERFIFDLQTAEGIKVKMIGQAFDKDDSGRYVLKSGYRQRINSVIYAEVMVALYTEYFSQRNFFAHSDNTENNMSRSIPEKERATAIFNELLDVVEYNAKKLKEINFSMVKQA